MEACCNNPKASLINLKPNYYNHFNHKRCIIFFFTAVRFPYISLHQSHFYVFTEELLLVQVGRETACLVLMAVLRR